MASITPHASYSDHDDHIHRLAPYHDEGDRSAYQFAPLEHFDSSLAPADYYRLPPDALWDAQDQTFLHPQYGYPPMAYQQDAPTGLDPHATWTRPNSEYMSNSTENEYGSEGNDHHERLNDQCCNGNRSVRFLSFFKLRKTDYLPGK
ncbi:hypothetical protein RhiJN_26269 [Ceratobasidium sp. AG-Ba]|nr:hypothetical protein RhiJN_26269 [Ceratobasidium sp. AG-Ba]